MSNCRHSSHFPVLYMCCFVLQDPLTEHAAYEQMALFASACAFSWSKWNARCGAEHLVMQVFSFTHRYSTTVEVYCTTWVAFTKNNLKFTHPQELQGREI